MNPMLLSKDTTFLIGQIATLLGYLMNGIFWILNKIGIPNTGLAIILFTIVIYMALMPLTIQQQKFSKMQTIMQPELAKIQKKYAGKKDQDSMMKQNEETQEVYRKYGVSASGSCIQLLIQMPILFALYRVFYNIPAYITQVKDAFQPLVDKLIVTAGSTDYLSATSAASQYASHFSNANFTDGVVSTYTQNTFIDVLNRFSTSDWQDLAAKFSGLSTDIQNTVSQLERYNNFLGLNIGNTPWYTFRQAISQHSVILIIAAVIVPVLAAVTQLINVALMPQPSNQSTGNSTADQMTNSMKTMNYIMPIMSAWFCFTLPAGMGLYWIAGSVIRSIQQVAINRSINKMDIDAYIARNVAKAEKKAAKRCGRETVSQKLMNQYSSMNTKSIGSESSTAKKSGASNRDKEEKIQEAKKYYDSGKYKQGSLASKANMVKDFNNANNNRSADSRSDKK